MKHLLLSTLLIPAIMSPAYAEQPKVVAVKQFSGIYPASHSLRVPFHGCVVLDTPAPLGEGEHWLSLDHLISDADFGKIQILVDPEGTILGARTVFKGSPEEWRGARGYAARQRVLFCFSLGGDGPELSRALPLAHDGSDFGGMVYTFDTRGNVSWRIPQGVSVTNETEYVKKQEEHKRLCPRCKDMNTAAHIVLRVKPAGEPTAPPNGVKPKN